MAPSFSENLSRINKSAEAFEKGANKIADLLRNVDDTLKATAPKVESDEFEFETTTRAYYSLYFGRDDDDAWGLCVRKYTVKHFEDQEGERHVVKDNWGDPEFDPAWSRQLCATPREIRIAAVAKMNDVLENLAMKIEQSLETMSEDEKQVKEIVEALAKKPAFKVRYTLLDGSQKWLVAAKKGFELGDSQEKAATFSSKDAALTAFNANGRDVRNPDGVEVLSV